MPAPQSGRAARHALLEAKADSESPAGIDKLNERLGLGMEPTTRVELVTCRLRNDPTLRMLL